MLGILGSVGHRLPYPGTTLSRGNQLCERARHSEQLDRRLFRRRRGESYGGDEQRFDMASITSKYTQVVAARIDRIRARGSIVFHCDPVIS